MSSDDGWVIRQNPAGYFVLQHYFASDDSYPPIDDTRAVIFTSLQGAINRFNEIETADFSSEYGLTIQTNVEFTSMKEDKMLKLNKFARKPFFVDAVQVDADNINEVAEWCQGEVRVTDKPEGAAVEQYVKVRVHRPLTEKQTKAFIGDWILYAGTGYKVYTPKAFEKSFESIYKATEPDEDSGTTVGDAIKGIKEAVTPLFTDKS